MKYEIMMRILFELLAKKVVSAKYLSDKYGISQRSVYRYMDDLGLAGVPVYTSRGNNGGFSVVDTYRLPSTFLSPEEFDKVISTLSAVTDGVPDDTLSSVIVKLKALIKNEYSGFDVKSGNLVIDGGPWGDSIGYKSKLKVLNKCIDENRKLFIRYHDREGNVSERVIRPHVLLFKQGLWYVYAYCEMRNTFRTFKTGRIEYANALKETFTRETLNKDDIPLNWFDKVPTEDVTLEISPACLSDITEWLGVENVYEENGKKIARAKLPFDDGLISKIMSYGKGVKVVAPDKLKDKIASTLKELCTLYAE